MSLKENQIACIGEVVERGFYKAKDGTIYYVVAVRTSKDVTNNRPFNVTVSKFYSMNLNKRESSLNSIEKTFKIGLLDCFDKGELLSNCGIIGEVVEAVVNVDKEESGKTRYSCAWLNNLGSGLSFMSGNQLSEINSLFGNGNTPQAEENQQTQDKEEHLPF